MSQRAAPEQIQVQQPTPDRLALSGALTFSTATQALQLARPAIEGGALMLDLSGVVQADSAGLAVVIALSRQCAARGQTLQLRSAPAGLRALAQLCDVDKLLGLEPVPEATVKG